MRLRSIPILLLLGVLQLGLMPLSAAPGKPNILFIAVDDLNDWISPLGGHAQTVTPNITRLAAKGVLFENAHCAAPACNPSRAALLWGVRPSTSGVYFNDQPIGLAPFLRNRLTLPEYLRRHGYGVTGAGKVFHGSSGNPGFWDAFFERGADPVPQRRPANGLAQTGHFDWGAVDAGSGEMSDARTAGWICRQLEGDHSKPFFLACGFYRPHLPWYVPQEYLEAFPLESVQLPTVLEDDLADIPEAGRRMARRGDHRRVLQANQWRQAVQAYLASIHFVDRQIGRVLDALEASPHRDNTYIVFWTDHGWSLGQKEHWRKFALWETTTRTPVVISGPGITPGRRSQPVSLLDLFPTIVDLAGLPANPDNEGTSLRPLLEGDRATWNAVAITTHGRGNHAVRDSRWRYIRYADGSEELYDHSTDPLEHHNLSGREELLDTKDRLARHLPAGEAENSPRHKDRERDGNRGNATRKEAGEQP